jgi:hypothetical protein
LSGKLETVVPAVKADGAALDDEPDKRAGAVLKTDGRREALRCKPAVIRHLDSEPARRRPRLEIEWALRRWGSGPPLSATLESQPDRRAGTASNTDGTERCEAQVLGSPPYTIAPGRTYAGAAEEFAASAPFRG